MSEPETRKRSIGWTLFRWLLVLPAVWGAYMIGLYLRLFFLPVGTGRVWGDLAGTFAIEALVVLAGAIAAPRYKLLVATALGAIGIVFRDSFPAFEDSLLGLALGGISAVSLVASISHWKRLPIAIVFFAISAGACGACVHIAETRNEVEEENPDAVPPFIQAVLGARHQEIRAVYVYDNSFMMTTVEACRVDASLELLEVLIGALHLRRLDVLPEQFWEEPMSYWPRGLPAGGECFGRELTIDEGDSLFGDDHEQIYLLYDKSASRVFITYYASL